MCGVVRKILVYSLILALFVVGSASAEHRKVLKDRYVISRVPSFAVQSRSLRKYGGLAEKKSHAGYLGFIEIEAVEVKYQSNLRSKKSEEVVDFNPAEAEAWCKALKESDPSVIDCEPDYLFEIQSSDLLYTPSDPNYTNIKSNLNSMNVREAWDITKGSKNVLVAVIDTGVDYNHEDLQANIAVNSNEIANDGIDNDGNGYIDDVIGFDLYSNDNDPMDEHYHGTHVAGTIGAAMDNDVGLVGVSPNVGIVPVRVMSPLGKGSYSKILAGVNYAIARGVDVMNMSIG
ncbi:MAG: S8 family serine peptidase, partial [Bdellovibrionales bacterium]|nr:S8 family serine peptidase [Bdellovibrionales bacterium]